MRRLGILAVALFAVAATMAGQSTNFTVEAAAASTFELVVKKTGLMSGKEHLFVFPRYSGELAYDATAPEQSKITLRIDAASIECKDDWLSDKDRTKVMAEATETMLQVAKHKELIFQSKAIQKQADGSYKVQGDLSIRGIAKPVMVAVKMTPNADGSIAFTGDSTIDMTAWGLKPPKALLGAIGTDKDMLLRFTVVARKR